MNVIKQISKKYSIVLHQVRTNDQFCKANGIDWYLNHSSCCGSWQRYRDGLNKDCPEIWLGIYDDKEQRLISFFHEVGHIIDETDWSINANTTTSYKAEKNAWKLGYKLAKEYGITFSVGAKRWAAKQLKTYKEK